MDRAGRDKVFRSLVLEMARVRTLCPLLTLITQRLSERPNIALARVWLRRPGDICEQCHMAAECADRSECLHLVASAGESVVTGENWSSLDGFYRRFPLGARKVGKIGAEGEPILMVDLDRDASWLSRPEWAQREGIRAFGGQPLIYDGEVLGVLAVFTRNVLEPESCDWLRLIADHAAGAIANARAFEEIERLRRGLELENSCLRDEVNAQSGEIVGRSAALRNVLKQIEMVAPTDASVLIMGESGTGKELVAREIHRRGERARFPLIRVNCASVPQDLYESEFFGHAKGSFTGAVRDRPGRFEAADQGTLFLDEVGEIPPALQSKLLRVLQEGQYERVGEEQTREVDVRIIAATNRDLEREIEQGRFRRDLFYRLNVFPLEIPPLRRRREDIIPLAKHFLAILARKLNRPRPQLASAQLDLLRRYDWPGNVRELRNVLERAMITSPRGALAFDLRGETRIADPEPAPQEDARVLSDTEMRQRERANLLAALERTGWKVSGPGGAAELLGIRPTTLAYRIQKMDLERPR